MSQYRRIPLDMLHVDPRYQREEDPRRISRMSEHLDDRLLGTVVVSDRGKSGMYLIDGQQRVAALRLADKRDVAAIVHEGLTDKAESEIFRLLQTERKNLRPMELFRAALFEGRKEETEVNDAVEAAGFHISTRSDAGTTIQAVATLMSIYKRGGLELLTWTLDVAAVWQTEEKSIDGKILDGIATFLIDTRGRMDEGLLKRRLAGIPTIMLKRTAIELQAMTGGADGAGTRRRYMAAAVLKIYNKRLSPERRLSLVIESEEAAA